MIEQIVESSFIEKIEWHEADVNIDQPAQIWVYFIDGPIKCFKSNRETFDNFCAAESPGKFYHQHLLGKSKHIPWQVQNAQNIAKAGIMTEGSGAVPHHAHNMETAGSTPVPPTNL